MDLKMDQKYSFSIYLIIAVVDNQSHQTAEHVYFLTRHDTDFNAEKPRKKLICAAETLIKRRSTC